MKISLYRVPINGFQYSAVLCGILAHFTRPFSANAAEFSLSHYRQHTWNFGVQYMELSMRNFTHFR